MESELERFVANPELSTLEKCKKSVLFEIALAYDIPVARTLRNDSLKAAVIHGLCDQGVLTEEHGAAATPPTPADEKPSTDVQARS